MCICSSAPSFLWSSDFFMYWHRTQILCLLSLFLSFLYSSCSLNSTYFICPSVSLLYSACILYVLGIRPLSPLSPSLCILRSVCLWCLTFSSFIWLSHLSLVVSHRLFTIVLMSIPRTSGMFFNTSLLADIRAARLWARLQGTPEASFRFSPIDVNRVTRLDIEAYPWTYPIGEWLEGSLK